MEQLELAIQEIKKEMPGLELKENEPMSAHCSFRIGGPVRPGRNLAVIMELAAMNNRQKKMGYNAAEALAMEHDMAIDAGLL